MKGVHMETAQLTPGTMFMARIRACKPPTRPPVRGCMRGNSLASAPRGAVSRRARIRVAAPRSADVSRAMLADVQHYIFASLQRKKMRHLSFFFSGPEVPGEGETKVQDRLLQNIRRDPGDTHCWSVLPPQLHTSCITQM